MASPPAPASVTRSAASLLTSRLAVAGIALLFLGVSTRLLSVEEIAVFAVYSTFCGAITVVCSLGLLASSIKLVPAMTARGDRAGAASLLTLAMRVYAGGALLFGGALWIGAEPLAALLMKDPGRAADLRWAAMASVCYGMYEASQLLLTSLQRFGDLGRFNVATAMTQRLLSLGLFFPWGLRGYLAGFALGSLAGAGMGLTRILPAARGGGEGEPARGAIRFAAPFYADGFLRYFYMHADQLLVGILLPPAALSLYFVAKRFLAYCNVVVSSLVDPLGARAAELSAMAPADLRRTAVAAARWIVLLFVPLATLLACISPFLLTVVGGRPYEAGAVPLAMLFLSVPAYAVFSLFGVLVHALGDPIERLRSNLVAMAAQAATILLVALALRLMGAASLVAALAGLASARLVGFGLGAFYSRHRLRPRLGGVVAIVPEAAGGVVVSVSAMALVILGGQVWLGRPLLQPLFAAAGILICLAGYRAMVFRGEDLTRLAGSLPGGPLGPRLSRWLGAAGEARGR